MMKVDPESAKLVLIDLADAFGQDNPDLDLQSIAEEGRLYLKSGKAVYRLRAPVVLANGSKLEEVALRPPTKDDYDEYARGLSVTVSKTGETKVDTVMMNTVATAAIERLTAGTEAGDASPWAGMLGRMMRSDFKALTEVCSALGFFD